MQLPSLGVLKCIIIIFLEIKLINSTSIIGVFDRDSVGKPIYLQRSIGDPTYEGIFGRFLRNLLDLLSTDFPDKKLPRYCRLLNRHLRAMDFKYTSRLAKHMRYLSRMYREDLKEEMKAYRKELDKKLPFRTEFITAMNAVFTLRENILFDDYIYDLRDYGNEDKLYIDDETIKILNSVIVGSIYKILPRTRVELEKKLRRAVKEYQDEYLKDV